MSYIAFWLFLIFSSGIIAGRFLDLPFYLPVLLALLFLFLANLFYRKKRLGSFDVCLVILFFFLGLSWINCRSFSLPEELLGKDISILARVESVPRVSQKLKIYQINSDYIIRGSERISLSAAIAVKDYSKGDISYLDFYVFKGRLGKSFYGKKRYIFYIRAKDRPLRIKESWGLRKLAFGFSEKAALVIRSNFPEKISTFILSVFLGRRENLPFRIKEVFQYAGTSHILAISGLHVGIVAGILLFFLKLFKLKLKSRLILVMFMVLGYAFLCQLKAPVLRAAVMFFCFSLSFLLKRKFLVFNSLAVAGLINLFLRPADLFSVSFQFSFIAVFFIILGFRYFYSSGKLTLFAKIKTLLLMSLFANLGLLPLVSFYFGRIYFLNIFTSILVIPYLGLIFCSLFIFIGVYLIIPLRLVIAEACSFLVAIFLKINYIFSKLPFSYFEYEFSGPQIFIYYFCLVVAGLCFNRFWLDKIRAKRSA